MSDQSKICPQCSEPLTSEAPGGLCPRCVMRMNLMPDTLPGTPGATPTVADLAPHFPQLEVGARNRPRGRLSLRKNR